MLISYYAIFKLTHRCHFGFFKPEELFWSSANSPGLFESLPDMAPISRSPALPLSRTGHQIARIKSSLVLFCALVWDVAHCFLKTWIFLIRSTVSGAFLHVFSHWQIISAPKRWSLILIVCISCKTSYKVLSYSHWGLGQFVVGRVRRNLEGGGSEKEWVSRF